VIVMQKEGVRKRCACCKVIAHAGCAEQVCHVFILSEYQFSSNWWLEYFCRILLFFNHLFVFLEFPVMYVRLSHLSVEYCARHRRNKRSYEN